MTRRSSRDRNLRDGEIAGTPMIAAHRASYAVAFTRGFGKSRLSSLGAPQTPRCPRSFQARTSAAEGGRLRDAFGAARRRPDRCKIQDQELKTEPLPCLINSAGSSTYPTRKSVRTTQATPPIGSMEAWPLVWVWSTRLTERQRIRRQEHIAVATEKRVLPASVRDASGVAAAG